MTRRISMVLAAAAMIVAAGVARAETWEVSVIDYAFVPAELTIAPGDEVRWTNNGFDVHTATSGTDCVEDGMFDSGLLLPGEEFTWQFDNLGDYPYFCIPHCLMDMVGMIRVVEVTPVEASSWGQIKSLYR